MFNINFRNKTLYLNDISASKNIRGNQLLTMLEDFVSITDLTKIIIEFDTSYISLCPDKNIDLSLFKIITDNGESWYNSRGYYDYKPSAETNKKYNNSVLQMSFVNFFKNQCYDENKIKINEYYNKSDKKITIRDYIIMIWNDIKKKGCNDKDMEEKYNLLIGLMDNVKKRLELKFNNNLLFKEFPKRGGKCYNKYSRKTKRKYSRKTKRKNTRKTS